MLLSSMADPFLRKHFCFLTLFLLGMEGSSPAHLQTQPQAPEDTFPPLWHLVPENIEDYPIRNHKTVINVWNYLERLGLYKILLKSSAKYFSGLGPNNVNNILWGLPLQHGWQYRSGRLADPFNSTGCGHMDRESLCISEFSWWACMNYYLAAIPFLGALDSDFFEELPNEVELMPPDKQREHFCLSTAECNTQIPKVMSAWRDFFKYLLSTAPNSETASSPLFSEDEALGYMWKAHTLSISSAFRKCQKSLSYFSGPESNFGEAWSTTVNFLAATHFPTNFNVTNNFQTGFPPRILLEGDKVPFIDDFTLLQNKVIFLLESLHTTNKNTDLNWLRRILRKMRKLVLKHVDEHTIAKMYTNFYWICWIQYNA
ncbi:protein LEG1 homolog isoform X3 [Crotalus tigris]|uniref:protein LEG1 homolog isoform X3 n=1 Tax=Crotalus tigris TaxID=88082 RepID=UPI00192F78D2|nr:protein LEG1 homolog isoform X3 [Crotalus tigris]